MEERSFLRNTDIIKLEGVKKSQASRIYNLIRDIFNKRKDQKVLISEYAEYREIPLMIVKKELNIK